MAPQLMEYWARLRGPEPYPPIDDLDVEAVPGFGPRAFMLDLGHDPEDPLVRYVGQEFSAERAKKAAGRKLSEVPPGSLLARVASRYHEMLDSKEPSEFEYEYAGGPDRKTLCRGVLPPFTAEGKPIDYIVGAVTSRVVEVDTPEAGLKSQARAPFTTVVKLAFGSGCERTRLSEYAAALSYAKRCGRTPVDLKSFIESQQGGLKGCVRAERTARRTARRHRGAPHPG